VTTGDGTLDNRSADEPRPAKDQNAHNLTHPLSGSGTPQRLHAINAYILNILIVHDGAAFRQRRRFAMMIQRARPGRTQDIESVRDAASSTAGMSPQGATLQRHQNLIAGFYAIYQTSGLRITAANPDRGWWWRWRWSGSHL
jgi:hypothetical protein